MRIPGLCRELSKTSFKEFLYMFTSQGTGCHLIIDLLLTHGFSEGWIHVTSDVEALCFQVNSDFSKERMHNICHVVCIKPIYLFIRLDALYWRVHLFKWYSVFDLCTSALPLFNETALPETLKLAFCYLPSGLYLWQSECI